MKELEQELLNNGWKQDFLDDNSGYWFTKTYAFPVFDTIEITIDSDSGVMTFEFTGEQDNDYADITVNDIKTYQDVTKTIQEKLHN